MTPSQRSSYLTSLGLVDWRLRAAASAEATATHVEAADAQASAAPAAPLPDTEDAAATMQPEIGPRAKAAPAPASAPDAMPQPDDVAAPSSPAMPETAVADQPQVPVGQADVAALDWAQLQAWLDAQDRRGARRAVFGSGTPDADVLIVGEAPGAQEDQQGLPFVGPAGHMLDRMLAAINCSREHNVYITNICKFRPPNNRDPHADEVAADWPVLERQIELMQPKLVVAVGRVAGQTLLGSTQSLRDLRGRVHDYPRRDLPVIVTYHPAYLLRSPQDKGKSWADLRHIAALLRRGDGRGAAA